MSGDGKVVSFEAFKARRGQREEPRDVEPREPEPRKALTSDEVAHRFVMLAHLRSQNALPPSTIH